MGWRQLTLVAPTNTVASTRTPTKNPLPQCLKVLGQACLTENLSRRSGCRGLGLSYRSGGRRSTTSTGVRCRTGRRGGRRSRSRSGASARLRGSRLGSRAYRLDGLAFTALIHGGGPIKFVDDSGLIDGIVISVDCARITAIFTVSLSFPSGRSGVALAIYAATAILAAATALTPATATATALAAAASSRATAGLARALRPPGTSCAARAPSPVSTSGTFSPTGSLNGIGYFLAAAGLLDLLLNLLAQSVFLDGFLANLLGIVRVGRRGYLLQIILNRSLLALVNPLQCHRSVTS